MISLRAAIVIFAAATLTACGSSSPSPTSPASPATPTATTGTTVTIPQGARTLGTGGFAPNPVTVAVGTTVTWNNTDTASASHDVVSDSGAFDSGQFGTGKTFTFTFQTKGTFPYHCSIHPGMVGTVVVQ
jgi:plastocyanin